MTRPAFEFAFTVRAEHIDELGHVNNAVWVQWMEQVATAHWRSDADPKHQAEYVWVVTRHEIDYVSAAHEGESVIARTWVGETPKGARFDRFVEFTGPDGRVCVRARTVWAIVEKSSGRPVRVPAEVVAPFLAAR